MLAYPFFLEGRVAEAQDLLKMTPVERQAVKNEQIAEDFSMMQKPLQAQIFLVGKIME